MTLDILHRDETLIAVTKPNGLLVHPGREPEAKEWIAMKVRRDEIGRHHQIRRHLAGEGCPILGDHLYGDTGEKERFASATGLSRMLLHAHSLAFTHPMTRQPVRIESPIPREFRPFCPPVDVVGGMQGSFA